MAGGVQAREVLQLRRERSGFKQLADAPQLGIGQRRGHRGPLHQRQ